MGVREPRRDGFAGPAPGTAPLSKYDLLLAVVPACLLAGALGGATGPLPLVGGMGLGSVIAAVSVAYGLFVDAPTSAE